ncbi:efflux RND transporter periplasmic adaptor subunit [Herbaspirillum sp. HC18]|nr:efflux RND transporter periplasmic adaptor subunit [Herbaspirillum sp. HC18]
MNTGARIAAGAIAIIIAAGAGYWAGHREAGNPSVAASSADSGKKERKLLYYRNPMGLPDTSPVPKKDPMGMDYIPVYEGEDDAGSSSGIKIGTEKVQKLGVRTEKASLKSIDKAVRAAGRVEADERRIVTIAPKFEGYVERLHVNATGQAVGKGQALFEVYSPELVSAQREYAIAAQGVQSLKGADSDAQGGMKQLAESSLARLKNWDISEEQVKALARSGEARRTMTFRSPVAGIVTEKKAVQGMRFMPGEMLYQVTDLSSVWVLADVFEQDIGTVRPGVKAKVRINAYPDKTFEGAVTYIYPTLQSATRSVQVRVELPNPGQLLKPGMFADVELGAAGRASVVAVPSSAVIDSGTRRIVLVQAGEGRFEPREVRLGARGAEYVEVLDGVKEGEDVVVSANFLIDAESNLKAAVGSFTSPQQTNVPAKGAGHKGEGTVDAIDAQAGTVSIAHGAIASLNWPAMTMEFKVANESLLKNLKPGAPIAFEFVERQPGEWVITSFQPAAAVLPKVGSAPEAHRHNGH